MVYSSAPSLKPWSYPVIALFKGSVPNGTNGKKNSGFLPEERAWMTEIFDQVGFVDTHRKLYPEATGDAYTWWSNRGQAWAKNVGWRIDYQIATPGIAVTLKEAAVYKEQRFSDHAPLIVDYDYELEAQ